MKHIFDDSDKNKYEAYTKEEVLEVIQEAISSGELPEEINGLVLTFKNPVDNQAYKIAFCTQAKYNELVAGGQIEENCYYFITDDTSYDDLENAIATLQSGVNQHTNDIEDIKEDISDINDDITSLDGRIDTLEGIHLYRHDIKISGTGYGVYFTLYLSTNTTITSANVTDYIQSGKTINASGYHSQDYATGVCPITDVHNSSGTLNASYIRYREYHPNWETEEWNQPLTNGTYTDTITQIL